MDIVPFAVYFSQQWIPIRCVKPSSPAPHSIVRKLLLFLSSVMYYVILSLLPSDSLIRQRIVKKPWLFRKTADLHAQWRSAHVYGWSKPNTAAWSKKKLLSLSWLLLSWLSPPSHPRMPSAASFGADALHCRPSHTHTYTHTVDSASVCGACGALACLLPLREMFLLACILGWNNLTYP